MKSLLLYVGCGCYMTATLIHAYVYHGGWRSLELALLGLVLFFGVTSVLVWSDSHPWWYLTMRYAVWRKRLKG